MRERLFPRNPLQLLTCSSKLTLLHDAHTVIERDEKALVLNTGYFGDAFADCLETYGAKVDQVSAPVGGRPTMQQVEEALKKDKYKVLTFTHVDTCAF